MLVIIHTFGLKVAADYKMLLSLSLLIKPQKKERSKWYFKHTYLFVSFNINASKDLLLLERGSKSGSNKNIYDLVQGISDTC